MPTSSNLSTLRLALTTLFDEEELRTLCFDLGVAYDNLPAQGISGKARELVSYLDRRGRTQDLVEIVSRLRPELLSSAGVSDYGGQIAGNHITTIDRLVSERHTCPPTANTKIYHNLPHPDYEQFVGRLQQLARIHRLLLPTNRCSVITIEGTGGIGKSSLALEVAYYYLHNADVLPRNTRFAAIIWTSAQERVLTIQGIVQRYHPLRTLHDVFAAISITLQREDIIRANSAKQCEIVRNALTKQRTLLIIDNLEAAPEREAIMQFLREVPPPTKAIVCTRESIDAPSLIKLHEMSEEDAIRLIRQQCATRNVILSQHEMRDLSHHTGRVPLAIVWGIAQIAQGHGVQPMLAQLADAKSDVIGFCLQTAIERIRDTQSYELLQALSLFAVDAGREALQFIAGPERDATETDNALVELLKLSLLSKTGDRFRVLPLTKRYVVSTLNQETASAMYHRVADYLLALVKRCADENSGDRLDLYPEIDAEYANLLSIMEWCYANGEWEATLDFVHALTGGYYGSYMIGKGFYNDQILWIEHAAEAYLRLTEDQRRENKRKMVMLYNSGCWTHALRGEMESAVEQAKKAVSLSETSDDEMGRAMAFRQTGYVYLRLGKLDVAEEHFEAALAIWTQLNNRILIASLYANMGELAARQGNYTKAEDLYRTSVASLQVLKDCSNRLLSALLGLGNLLWSLGRAQEAKGYLEDGLELACRIGHIRGEAQCRLGLARVLLANNQQLESREVAASAYDVFDRLGMKEEACAVQELVQEIDSQLQY